MFWTSAANMRTRRVDDRLFDAMEQSIPGEDRLSSGDPEIETLLTPLYWERNGGPEWTKTYGMMLTAGDVCIARTTGLGGGRVENRRWSRYDFSGYHVGPWAGAVTRYQVLAAHEVEGRLGFIFASPDEARLLGEYFKNG